jgi:acyl-CoA synthetase (AMP-forming)/AMP-acid ligase II
MQQASRHGTDGDTGIPSAVMATARGSTVTTAVLGAVAEHTVGHAERPAVIDDANGRSLTYAEIASMVPAAGAGLTRRGVRTGDIAAVYVSGAVELALAVHALTAAGAVPVPMPPAASADELAERLNDCSARLLVTATPLGETAVAAADRSYVRQVFAFDDPAFDDPACGDSPIGDPAGVPGTTPFAELLMAGGLFPSVDPLHDLAFIQQPPIEETAAPPEQFTHADRLAALDRLAAAVAIDGGEVLVAAAAGCPAATWVGLIDVALLRGATFVAVTGSGSGPLLRAIEAHGATLTVVPPPALKMLACDDADDADDADDDAFHGEPGGAMRLLVAGAAPPELVEACHRRHGWTIESLT